MNTRRTALAALPAVALCCATAVSGGAANAATMHWKTLTTFNNAQLQACKRPTTATGPWKVSVRVNALRASSKVQGMATAFKGEQALPGGWTSGWVSPRHVSTIGTVKLPRGAAYSLSAGLGGGQSGNGGSFKAGSIPAC